MEAKIAKYIKIPPAKIKNIICMGQRGYGQELHNFKAYFFKKRRHFAPTS